jgi:hypothetical protein
VTFLGTGSGSKWNGKPSKKGTSFEQPLTAHQHSHIDVSYINLSGTFYYLCSVLDSQLHARNPAPELAVHFRPTGFQPKLGLVPLRKGPTNSTS